MGFLKNIYGGPPTQLADQVRPKLRDMDFEPDEGYDENGNPIPLPVPAPTPTPSPLPVPEPAIPPQEPIAPTPPIDEKREALKKALMDKMGSSESMKVSSESKTKAPIPVESGAPLPTESMEPSAKEKLYEDLRSKYAKDYGKEAEEAKVKEAQSTKMSKWRRFFGTFLMGMGTDPKTAQEMADKVDADKAKAVMDVWGAEKQGYQQQLAALDAEINSDPKSRKSHIARQFIKTMAPGIGKMPDFDNWSFDQLSTHFPQAKAIMDDTTKRLLAEESFSYKKELLTIKAQQEREKISAEMKTYLSENIKDFQKVEKLLPNMERRGRELEEVIGILDKHNVLTGPIAGKPMSFFIQKVLNVSDPQGAQALEFYRNREWVEAIMQMAKEAGARSVDSDAEARRLLMKLANPELNAKTYYQALLLMKSEMDYIQQTVLNKQQYLAEKGTLSGWKNEFIGKDPYYEKATGVIHWVSPSEPIPTNSEAVLPESAAKARVANKQTDSFPRQVRKEGKVATISNQAELDDAISKGWK